MVDYPLMVQVEPRVFKLRLNVRIRQEQFDIPKLLAKIKHWIESRDDMVNQVSLDVISDRGRDPDKWWQIRFERLDDAYMFMLCFSEWINRPEDWNYG